MRFFRAFENNDLWVLNLRTFYVIDALYIVQWNSLDIFWGHAELFLGKYGDTRSKGPEGKQEKGYF